MLVKKHNGQALVEFVILLPIFIFMLFSIIDFGKILYVKNNLESKMDDAITLYQNGHSEEEITEKMNLTKEKVTLIIEKEDQKRIFSLNKEVPILTPGLNLILKNPYEATAKRVIYNE